jgi:hypothetical protein
MFAKIVKGKDLSALESEVNKFISDHSLDKDPEKIAQEIVNELLPNSKPIIKKTLKIYNVQQFVVGEVDPKSVSLLNRQPVPVYSFCLLLICGYE